MPLVIRFDDTSDAVYMSTETVPAFSEEGSGLLWRYAQSDGRIVGLLIVDWQAFWKAKTAILFPEIAEKFAMSIEEVQALFNQL